MRTAYFSDWGVSIQTPPLDRPPPRKEHGTRDKDTRKSNMGLGSQTGSNIIQRPSCGQADTSETITLLQTSFAGDN